MLDDLKSEYIPIRTEETLDELSHKQINTWKVGFFLLLSASVSLGTILGGLLLWKSSSCTCFTRKPEIQTPYSPATQDLRYVNRYLTQDPDTPKFMGKPRPELDNAWHNLLEGTLIRYTMEELKHANNATSVAHVDGGYVGGLGISHTLHCLKRVKQYMHPEYYYVHEEQDWSELESHVDHCLESLRQTLLCQPDISVYTLQWTPHSRFKPTVRVPQAHSCVDWPKLHEWMKARAARLEDMVPPDPSLYENNA